MRRLIDRNLLTVYWWGLSPDHGMSLMFPIELRFRWWPVKGWLRKVAAALTFRHLCEPCPDRMGFIACTDPIADVSASMWHCPKCNSHLTSLNLCPECGRRWRPMPG